MQSSKDLIIIKKKIDLIVIKISLISDLHWVLTSSHGGKFRVQLLSLCEQGVSFAKIDHLREEHGLSESIRHISRLIQFKLISTDKVNGQEIFYRTLKGQQAINSVNTLIGRLGKEQAKKIFNASFGENAIRIFLELYGKKYEEILEEKYIYFTPAELGWLTLGISKSIEGIAAFEKLNDANLLVYKDDGNIYMPCKESRIIFRYLENLYNIIKVKLFRR